MKKAKLSIADDEEDLVWEELEKRIHDYQYIKVGPMGPQGPRGKGVPMGGKKGQILIKKSDKDFDTEWVNIEDIIGGNNE